MTDLFNLSFPLCYVILLIYIRFPLLLQHLVVVLGFNKGTLSRSYSC